MDYNSHYITKRSFYIAAAIAAVTVATAMATCLIASSMREASLKNEILSAVNTAISAKTEANNSFILRYLSDITSSDESAAVSATPLSPEFLYELREYNGKIAVISTGGNVIEILDVYVFTLPESDKSQLSIGIPLYSETELLSIIQDYTS